MHFVASQEPERPRQAVILAGGRGTRLRPLTDRCPKALIKFAGAPFIVHVIRMLKENQFAKVLLLLGYMPDIFQRTLGDGSHLGVEIEYSTTEPDDLTCRRMLVARPMLDPCFLLLYCDNYWPMQMDRMWKRFTDASVPAMVTVYRNRDNYSRDTVKVGTNGYVEVFDRSRTLPDLRGIEISYAILKRSVCDLIPTGSDALFEEIVYPELAQRRQLLAFETDHRYYSVGSHERLPLTSEFFARRPTILLDRDGVLNERPGRAEYVKSWEEFKWLPGAKEALRILNGAGYRVIVVSNQAGVARGAVTLTELEHIHDRLREDVAASGGRIDTFYCCTHNWEDGCDCRKPKPGMLFRAQREYHLDLTKTLFVGDDERDHVAAEAAGCRWASVTPQRRLLDIVKTEIAVAKAVT